MHLPGGGEGGVRAGHRSAVWDLLRLQPLHDLCGLSGYSGRPAGEAWVGVGRVCWSTDLCFFFCKILLSFIINIHFCKGVWTDLLSEMTCSAIHWSALMYECRVYLPKYSPATFLIGVCCLLELDFESLCFFLSRPARLFLSELKTARLQSLPSSSVSGWILCDLPWLLSPLS